MLRSASISSRVGGAVVLAALLLGGCDFFGFGSARPAEPTFQVTTDLPGRTRVLGGASGSASTASPRTASALTLTPVVQVRPPTVKGTRTQAGHLSYDDATDRLHVGYKLTGAPFGGGIDVLDVQPGAQADELVTGERSLRSTNVDVVAVQPRPGEDVLYMAGAVTTEKRRLSPAVVSRIVPGDTEVEARSKRLSHNVAKSLVLGPTPNTLHVATDENALFQFGPALNDQSKLTVGGTRGFRSVAIHDEQVFVLDLSGRVFETEASTFASLSRVLRLTDTPFGNGTVARLHADDDRLYAALNEKGFALFRPSGETAWKSAPVPAEERYTCVSAGPEHLYAGRFDGVIEVYQRPDTIPEQLERVGTFGPWTGSYGSQLSGAPINQILVVENHLFVANSRDGMVALRIDEE